MKKSKMSPSEMTSKIWSGELEEKIGKTGPKHYYASVAEFSYGQMKEVKKKKWKTSRRIFLWELMFEPISEEYYILFSWEDREVPGEPSHWRGEPVTMLEPLLEFEIFR